jgi:hypothetical protein
VSPAAVLAFAAADHDFSLGRFGGMHAVKKDGMAAVMEERLPGG